MQHWSSGVFINYAVNCALGKFCSSILREGAGKHTKLEKWTIKWAYDVVRSIVLPAFWKRRRAGLLSIWSLDHRVLKGKKKNSTLKWHPKQIGDHWRCFSTVVRCSLLPTLIHGTTAAFCARWSFQAIQRQHKYAEHIAIIMSGGGKGMGTSSDIASL